MDRFERLVEDDDASRLLGRMAAEVPVAPAPLDRVVDAARRQRRRHVLTVTAAVMFALIVLLLVALTG